MADSSLSERLRSYGLVAIESAEPQADPHGLLRIKIDQGQGNREVLMDIGGAAKLAADLKNSWPEVAQKLTDAVSLAQSK